MANHVHRVRAAGAALALTVLAPLAAQVTAYHGVDGGEHQTRYDDLSAKGYRMIALTIYGTTTVPRYAAVWVQRSGSKFLGFHGLDEAQYQALIDANYLTYTPTLLTAMGPASDPRFAGVLERSKTPARARHGLTWDELKVETQAQIDAGYRIATVDAYGDAGDTRYVVGYTPNDSKIGWGYYRASDRFEHNDKAAAAVTGYARLVSAGFNEDSSAFVALWHDTEVGSWVAHHDMTASEYQSYSDTYARRNGFYPIHVHASGSGSKARFAAVWAATDLPAQRQWSVTGQHVPELVAFDDWAKAHLQSTNTRAGMLAVVKDGRLVLARGYTWAEPGYPQTQPDSLCRVASLNKPLTSIVVHQEIQQQPTAVSYAHPMAGYFGNPAFADPRSNAITVRHLLVHEGGWDRDPVTGSGVDPMFYDATISTALGVPLPITTTAIRTYMQGQPLDFAPGSRDAYSNYGYSLLGRILERLHLGQSYDQVMQAQLFAPLGITRAVLGGPTKSQILPGELRYHPRVMRTARSVVDPARPWVPRRYGGANQPNLDAHGGYVMAAPDFAKVLASFDLGAQNPVLGPAQTASMWTAETSGRLRGWEEATVQNAVGADLQLTYHFGKLPGVITYAGRRADNVSFVFFTNGDDDCGLPSGTELSDLANAVAAWPAHDLFPSVGIPALQHVPGKASTYGQGCPGTNGAPGISYIGAPEVGATTQLVLTQGRPNAVAYCLLGARTAISLQQYFAPLCTLHALPGLALPATPNALGTAVTPVAFPPAPALIGLRLGAQYLVFDQGANSGGIVTTHGLELVLGGWLGM